MRLIGHIAELWRYPIKSMGGERCPSLVLTPAGIAGDRHLAFESADAPTGKPLLRAAQRASMLRATSTLDPHGVAHIHLPGHPSLRADDPATPTLLARALGLPPETALRLLQSPRPLTDVRPVALHSRALAPILTTELAATHVASFANFDDRRLRSNLILTLDPHALPAAAFPPAFPAAFPEDTLAGHRLQLGDHAQLQILERIPRCRIVALAPGTATPDPTLLPHLARTHGGRAGIYARPLTHGPLREHDPVFLLS